MGKYLVKPSSKKKPLQRTEEPVVKLVDKATFLSGIKKIEPVAVKGYVCLF